jgi:phosphoribosylaminoimidazolecarboxamide formyltransferase/IMP cyclohydrolase
MQPDEIKILSGENSNQSAEFEQNDRMIDYETSKNLNYADIISITKGLEVISEFYDVLGAAAVTPVGICAVSLGKTLEEAVTNVMDSNPIDFMSSTIVLSNEVDSDLAKMLKETHIVAAPKFTKNAIEYFETHNVCYVTIKTPLKDYRKYLANKTMVTPLGTLTQAPNLSELDKETFKVVTKTKPTTEQIEDAVFAWKVAKHISSRAIVIAKDLKTTAVAQGLQSASIEYALDYSCDRSKESILASDIGISIHDLNVAAQGRISLIIIPFAQKDIVVAADKFNISVIETGFTNILY